MPRPALLLDISLAPRTQAPAWPGDAPFTTTDTSTFAAQGYHSSALSLSAHAGTHMDAPGHVIKGGPLLDAYPISRFVLPAVVVDAGSGPLVESAAVAAAGLRPGEALLLRTDNAARGLVNPDGSIREDFTALSPDAARAAVDARASLVGIDAPSVDPFHSQDIPAHLALLHHDVLVLEWLDLSAAAPGRYTLSCLPLKLAGVEACPVRAVLSVP